MRLIFSLLIALTVAGCATVPMAPAVQGSGGRLQQAAVSSDFAEGDFRARARTFVEVARRVGPAAEDACRRNAPHMGCEIRIIVDDKSDIGANAYQTLDAQGKPIIAMTLPLIAEVRNADEIAFILGHEAAHHIAGHLQIANQNAAAGAQALGSWANRIPGVTEALVQSAVTIGAALGSRAYSKDFELEADMIGTFITAEAGYHPVNGARFFARLPEPGRSILSTHPGNSARFETVAQAYRSWLSAQ